MGAHLYGLPQRVALQDSKQSVCILMMLCARPSCWGCRNDGHGHAEGTLETLVCSTQGLDKFGKDIMILSTRNPFLGEQPPKQAPSLAAVFANAAAPGSPSADAAAFHRCCHGSSSAQQRTCACLAVSALSASPGGVLMY